MKNNYLFYLLFFTLIGWGLSECSEFLVDYLSGKPVASENPITESNLTAQIFLGIILSPIVETYIFQHLILINSRKVFDTYPQNYIGGRILTIHFLLPFLLKNIADIFLLFNPL